MKKGYYTNDFKKDFTIIFEKYKDYLWDEIPKLTKEKWKVKSFKIRFSSRTQNCFIDNNNFIVIGIRGLKQEWKGVIAGIIIHELLHLNTTSIINSLKGTKHRFDVLEIATCTLTNILIDKVNEKFRKGYRHIHFEEPYKSYEKFKPQLRKLFYKSKNFKDFIFKIKERYLNQP